MKVAVTGASGHIGLNLTAKLRKLGHEVRAFFHTRDDIDLFKQWNLECHKIDIRDPKTLSQAFKDCEIVYHLAGKISIDGDQNGIVTTTNIDGAKNVAQAALSQGVRRMVHVSSIHAFNRFPRDAILNETRPRANDKYHSAYDRSKAAGEAAVREVIQQGLDAVIIHPVGVIGPLDYLPSYMGKGLLAYYQKKILTNIEGGFNWVHMDDVVDMMIAAADKGRCNESYIIAGHWHSVKSVANMVELITGVKTPRLSCPLWLAKIGLPPQQLWWNLKKQSPLYTYESLAALKSFRKIDDSKARQELGHHPRPIEAAIYQLFSWLQQQGQIDPDIKLKRI